MNFPLRALRDTVPTCSVCAGALPPAMAGQLLDRLRQLDPGLLRLAPLIAEVAHLEVPSTPEVDELEPRFRPDRQADALVRLLALCITGPLVVVVDDAHWLDDASTNLLARVAAAADGADGRPWLVISLRRPAAEQPEADADETVITVTSLPDSEASELVWSAPDVHVRPHDVRAIVARAAGNPLFLQELLRHVAQTAPAAGAAALPDTLEAVLGAEIDALPRDARQVLRCAAVLGLSFRTEALELSCGPTTSPSARSWRPSCGTSSSPTASAGASARRWRATSPTRACPIAGGASCTGGPERRPSASPRAASSRWPTCWPATTPRRRTWTWRGATPGSPRSGPGPPTPTRRRPPTTSRPSTPSGGYPTSPTPRRPRCGAGWATPASSSGCSPRRSTPTGGPRPSYGTTRRPRPGWRCGAAGPGSRAAPTPRRCGRCGRPAPAWPPSTPRSPDGGGPASPRSRRSSARARSGHAKGWRWPSGPSTEAETAGERFALAQAYSVIDWALIVLGRAGEAVLAQRALAIFEELGDLSRQAAGAVNNLGAAAYFSGDWTAAIAYYERSAEASRRSGNEVQAALGAMNTGELLVNQGRLDEAEPILQEALRVLQASGSDAAHFAEMQFGRVALERGDLRLAERLMTHAQQDARGHRAVGIGTGGRHPPGALPPPAGRPRPGAGDARAAQRTARGEAALYDVLAAEVETMILIELDLLKEARGVYEAAVADARRQGLVFELALLLLTGAAIDARAGDATRSPRLGRGGDDPHRAGLRGTPRLPARGGSGLTRASGPSGDRRPRSSAR